MFDSAPSELELSERLFLNKNNASGINRIQKRALGWVARYSSAWDSRGTKFTSAWQVRRLSHETSTETKISRKNVLKNANS